MYLKFMRETSLEAIMGNLESKETTRADEKRMPITVWVPAAVKEAYDREQERTGRELSKRLPEVVAAAVEISKKRAG